MRRHARAVRASARRLDTCTLPGETPAIRSTRNARVRWRAIGATIAATRASASAAPRCRFDGVAGTPGHRGGCRIPDARLGPSADGSAAGAMVAIARPRVRPASRSSMPGHCRCVGQPSGAARWPLRRRAHRADRPDAPLTEPTKVRRSLRIIGSLARGRRLAASLGAAVDRREGESPRGSRLVGSGSEPAPRFDAAVRAGRPVHEGRCRSGETNSRRSRAPSSGSDLADMPAFEARAQTRRGACLDRPLPSPDPNHADRRRRRSRERTSAPPSPPEAGRTADIACSRAIGEGLTRRQDR